MARTPLQKPTLGLDFNEMDLSALAKVRAELDAAFKRKKKEALRQIIDGCAEQIRASGNSAGDFIAEFEALLLPRKSSRKRGAGLSTYKDPASGATWSGKGKAPSWMKAHLDAGGKKEELKVS